jgi:superfamily I DNA/RNA helicase
VELQKMQLALRGPNVEPSTDIINDLNVHASKGLEFPVVALCGSGQMPAEGQDEADEARLFYVAATRATHELFIPLSGAGRLASRLVGEPA